MLKTWLKNIGNGFIDKGAVSAVRQAFPDAEIIEASGHPNYVDDVERQKSIPFLPDRITSKYQSITESDSLNKECFDVNSEGNMINIGELVDADIAILPGCVLYPHVFDKYIDTLVDIRERSIPLILLGAGGGDYEPSTVKKTRQVLEYLDPAAMLTRDRQAYNNYKNLVDFAYDGIDCGFFVNDWYTPPKANQEFIAATFDKSEEPKINDSRRVLRPNHGPYPTYGNKVRPKYYEKQDTLLSDCLEDYLFVYANAQETHSDRIHACVPALVYGNKARFYYSTPRASLFDRLLSGEINNGMVKVDREQLKNEKSEQVMALQTAMKDVI